MQGEGTMPRDSVDRRITYDKASVAAYKRVQVGDFILHLRSFEGGLEKANDIGIVSPAYTILRSKQDICTMYFYSYFRSYWFINNKLRIAVEGIRDGKSINMITFWNITIPVPSISEQERIASFLTKITNKIKAEEKVLLALQKTKSFLVNKMFI